MKEGNRRYPSYQAHHIPTSFYGDDGFGNLVEVDYTVVYFVYWVYQERECC